MSSRSSKSALFINSTRYHMFKQGISITSPNDLRELEKLFVKWKSKPWNIKREYILGVLSTRIKRARAHLDGISKFSTLNRFANK